MIPILKSIAKYTRMDALTLVNVHWVSEVNNFKTRAVNFGEIKGAVLKNFLQWNPNAFKKVFYGQITIFTKEARSK